MEARTGLGQIRARKRSLGLVLGLLLGLASVPLAPPVQAQETPRTFDIFGDEDDEDEAEPEPDDQALPEGDAADVDEEAPVESEVPPVQTEPSVTVETSSSGAVLVLVFSETEAEHGHAALLAARTQEKLAVRDGLAPALRARLDESEKARRGAEVKEALRGIDRGLGALQDLELEDALAELGVAVDDLLAHERNLTVVERDRLVDGLLFLGAAALFQGDAAQADSIFSGVLLFEPDAELTPGLLPSNVSERLAQLREAPVGAPGDMRVESTPPGAIVYVDGLRRGSTPMTVLGLSPADHLVTLERLGSRSRGTLVTVESDAEAIHAVDLSSSGDLDLGDVGLVYDRDRLAEIGERVGASRLLALDLEARISGRSVRGVYLDVPAKMAIAELSELQVVTDADVASDTVLRALDEARQADALAESITSEPEIGDPLVEQWWFWAIVGGAVAAASVVSVAVVSGSNRPPNSAHIFGF